MYQYIKCRNFWNRSLRNHLHPLLNLDELKAKNFHVNNFKSISIYWDSTKVCLENTWWQIHMMILAIRLIIAVSSYTFSFHFMFPILKYGTICTGIFGDLDSTYLQYHSNPLFDSVEKMVFVQSEKIVIQINF